MARAAGDLDVGDEPDTRGVSVFRESLIQKGLIWSPRRGQVDFVPLFAEFVRANPPGLI